MTVRFDAWRDIVQLHRSSACDPGLHGDASRDELFAVVLAGGSGTRVARLVERLSGSRTPKQYSDFGAARVGGEAASLLQRTLARIGRHVPERATHVMIAKDQELRATRQLMAWSGARVHAQADDCGTAVATVVALLEILTVQPEATIIITPSDGVVSDAALFDSILENAVRIAANDDAVVLIGAEPSRPLAGESWLVPFDVGPMHRRPRMLPFARHVHRASLAQAAELRRCGGLVDTLMVVAKGRVLLDLYASLTPRVLRLFLFAASVPPAEREAFLQKAYTGLGALDLQADLIALGHGQRIAVLPESAGWMKIETDLQALVWLAGRRHVEPTRWPISRGVRDGARRALP